MYTNTTGVQVARAVAVWVLGFGIALFPFIAADLFAGRAWDAVLTCLGLIAAGAGTIVWAKWRLARLDERNRPFLHSPEGSSILAPRQKFQARVTIAKRVLFVLFLVLAVAFLVLVSAVNCAVGQGGFCGMVTRPSDATLEFLQFSTIAAGMLYVAGVVLSRTHEAETERLDLIIAQGQKDRREGGPLGSLRRGWD